MFVLSVEFSSLLPDNENTMNRNSQQFLKSVAFLSFWRHHRVIAEAARNRNQELKKRSQSFIEFLFSLLSNLNFIERRFFFFIYNIYFVAYFANPWTLLSGAAAPLASYVSESGYIPYCTTSMKLVNEKAD